MIGEKLVLGLSIYARKYREDIYYKALKAYHRDPIPTKNYRFGIIFIAFFNRGCRDLNSFPLLQDWTAEACRNILKRAVFKQYVDKVVSIDVPSHILVEFGVEEEFNSRVRYLTRQTNQEKIEFDRKFRELQE